ncbi:MULTISPECIES: organic hydroperoxide resistance protein [Jeotgalibacillus]|uniref:organic hydroperoxide resistance protein n=1 Tax=Jeotgalibacillus TaxID=157226 RepID=UPI00106968E7|nr:MULTISPECIES: organic hydroperoxide resistance protein [Jeotgalibacillus]TFD96622.1 organic hydroperoxide resistance protein [Jeotgalibacillus sp. R-1-5s-1]
MKKLFTATATAQGGREGKVRSESGVLDLELTTPRPDAKPNATNPEELFAAGYSACFDSAMSIIAMQKKIEHTGTEVTAHVSLNKGDAGYIISVDMDVLVKGVDEETAQNLVHAAHEVCPYSNATRGNVDVNFTVHVA